MAPGTHGQAGTQEAVTRTLPGRTQVRKCFASFLTIRDAGKPRYSQSAVVRLHDGVERLAR